MTGAIDYVIDGHRAVTVATQSAGPATLQVKLRDALYRMDERTLLAHARIQASA